MRITANRVLSPNGYPKDSGVSAGIVEKYKADNLTHGSDVIVKVWDAYRPDGSEVYNNHKYWYSDKEITVLFRHPQYIDNIVRTDTYLGAFDETKNIMIVDKAYDTSIPLGSVTGVTVSGTTITVTADMDAQHLYNALKEYTTVTLDKDPFMSLNVDALDLGAYDIIIDGATIDKTSRFVKLVAGSITKVNGGDVKLLHVDVTGNVKLTVNVQAEPAVINKVYGVWDFSQGELNRVGILTANSGESLDVLPDTDLYVVADGINALRSTPIKVNTGPYGAVVDIPILRLKHVDGSNLLPDSLTAVQQRIADMFVYDAATGVIAITLPSDYATDSRWDKDSKTFSLEGDDYTPMSFKAERIQSADYSLISPTTVAIRLGSMVLDPASPLKFIQASTNPECVINMTAFGLRREGDTKNLTTFLDQSNGTITCNSGAPIVATVPVSVFKGVAKSSEVTIVNNNIIKASKLIPTNDALPTLSETHNVDPSYTNNPPAAGTRWFSELSGQMFVSTGLSGPGEVQWNGNKGTKILLPYTNIQLKQAITDAIAAGTPVNSLITTGVTDMSELFQDMSTFDEPLNSWDTSSVVNMDRIFKGATAFNQNIVLWDASKVTSATDFKTGSALECSNIPANIDKSLIAGCP